MYEAKPMDTTLLHTPRETPLRVQRTMRTCSDASGNEKSIIYIYISMNNIIAMYMFLSSSLNPSFVLQHNHLNGIVIIRLALPYSKTLSKQD